MRVVCDVLARSFDTPEKLAQAARLLLEGVVGVNRLIIQARLVPPLFESGVRYRPELGPNGHEEFATCDTVYQRQCGDCDDLAAWFVAEEREAGRAATLQIFWKGWGPLGPVRMFHVLVRKQDFKLWDPSRMLGM